MRLMSKRHNNRMSSHASWFALGLLSGAAVALLTSPKSGRDNRKMLSRRAKEVADAVTEQGGAFIDQQTQQVTKVVENGRSEALAFGARVTDALQHGKTAYRTAKNRFESAAASVGDGVRQAADDVAGRG